MINIPPQNNNTNYFPFYSTNNNDEQKVPSCLRASLILLTNTCLRTALGIEDEIKRLDFDSTFKWLLENIDEKTNAPSNGQDLELVLEKLWCLLKGDVPSSLSRHKELVLEKARKCDLKLGE